MMNEVEDDPSHSSKWQLGGHYNSNATIMKTWLDDETDVTLEIETVLWSGNT